MTKAMTEKELKEIRARVDAATPGPWQLAISVWGEDRSRRQIDALETVADSKDICYFGGDTFENEADAHFIAHARADIERLLTEIERLRGLSSKYPLDVAKY